MKINLAPVVFVPRTNAEPISDDSFACRAEPRSGIKLFAADGFDAPKQKDVALDVTWQSQITTGKNCFQTCKAMASSADATVGGSDQGYRIGAKDVDATQIAEAQKYLDAELDAGRPVTVGVDRKAGSVNADGVTDHFVVITGRSTDAAGNVTYAFHDPASANESVGSDARTENRFSVDAKTGKLYRPAVAGEPTQYATNQRYDLSWVRRNTQSN